MLMHHYLFFPVLLMRGHKEEPFSVVWFDFDNSQAYNESTHWPVYTGVSFVFGKQRWPGEDRTGHGVILMADGSAAPRRPRRGRKSDIPAPLAARFRRRVAPSSPRDITPCFLRRPRLCRADRDSCRCGHLGMTTRPCQAGLLQNPGFLLILSAQTKSRTSLR